MTMYDKLAAMKPEQKNHWFDIPELSYWGERFFAEFSVAEALAKPEELPILQEAIDGLYDAFTAQHALTDSACQEAEKKLLPFSQRAKAYNLHCVAHAHIDMDWLWGLHETVDVTLSTFRTMLDLMDEYPDFTYSQSQCATYKMAKFYDPSLFRRIRDRVQEGRWEFAGSAWVEPDKNMPNLESMTRHILYTKQFLNEQFGIPYEDGKLDFEPDTFGHSGSVPEILSAGGIRFFYHCRGLDGQYFYRWRGNSGAEVLALNEPLWYNDWIRPMYLNQVPKVCSQYGIRDMMKIYGVGDHGGGPTHQDVERILDMQTWPVAPTIFFSTYKRYFESIEPFKDHFPVVTGELGPTFTGCYTSQSRIKQSNRIAEDRLFLTESLCAMAEKETGLESFGPQLRTAWEHTLFNQFHDILPGTNVPESRDHALGLFGETMGVVMAASGAALRSFADSIDTSRFDTPADSLTSRSQGGGVGLNVDQDHRFRLPGVERGVGKNRLLHFFNPTSFPREEVLEATLWDWPGDPERIRAFDTRGRELPVTANTISNLEWNHIRTDILVKAAVPALGYTTVRVGEAPKQRFCFTALPPDPRVPYNHPQVLGNKLVRAGIAQTDLHLVRYVSKESGADLLGEAGGRFFLYQEGNVPKGGCAWVEGVNRDPKDLHLVGNPFLKAPVSGSALRQSFCYELRYGDSILTVTPRLDAGSPILELDVQADWRELGGPSGTPKLTFRLDLKEAPREFLSDSQIGLEHRPPLPIHDICSRNFLFGAGMALLTDSKYGYRGYGHRMEVSLLRASTRPDPMPEMGKRVFRLGISAAEENCGQLKALASRFAHRDLPYCSNRAHKGSLPLEKEFLTVTGAQVTCLKTAEDGRGMILRLASLEEDRVTISVPGLKEVRLTDLAEQDLQVVEIQEETAALSMRVGQVKTLRLIF